MKQVTDRRYDLSGSEVIRVAKHALISNFAKYEDFSGGPGFRDLLIAFLVHYFGGILAWALIRFESRSARLANFLWKRPGGG